MLRASRSALTALLLGAIAILPLEGGKPSAARPGYYRSPAIHGDIIIFTAEGDLWTVGRKGGAAQRLTSNPGPETNATISPDGTTVAFSAR